MRPTPAFLNYLYYPTFGANRRSIFYALLIEGISIFSILSVSRSGDLQLPDIPHLPTVFAFIGFLIFIVTFFLVYSISRETFSPALHSYRAAFIISLFYAGIGLSGTAIGFIFSSYLASKTIIPNVQEIGVGTGIGLLYGMLVLIYYDRYEVSPPENKEKIQKLSKKFVDYYEHLSETEKAPIQLTDSYSEFLCAGGEMSEVLDQAQTPDGKQLHQDLESWVQDFGSHQETTQNAVITGNSSNEELQNEHKRLRRIIERLRKFSDHESARNHR